MNEEIVLKLNSIENQLKNQVVLNKIFLTIEECSFYTGLSSTTLYQFTSKNEIPHYKPGGKKVYFMKEEIDTWVFSNRVSTSDEIENKALNYLMEN